MIKKLFAVLFGLALVATAVGVMRRNTGMITLDNAYVSGRVLKISAGADGTVQTYAARRAAYVRKGERLFSIGEIDKAARLKEYRELLGVAIEDEVQTCRDVAGARTSLSRATTNASYADGNLQRVKSLAQVGMMTREMLEKREQEMAMSALDTTAAQLALDKLAMRNRLPILERPKVQYAVARLQAAFNEAYAADVLAPDDGYIYELQTYTGQYVQKGDNLLVFLPKEEQIIEANVLESDVASLRAGSRVTVVPDVGGGKRIYSGIIQSIVPSVAATFSQLPRNNLDSNWIKTSQRIPVLITLAPPTGDVAPLPLGSSVKVIIDVRQAAVLGAAPAQPQAQAQRSAYRPAAAEPAIEHDLSRRYAAYLREILASFPHGGGRKCH
jgi:membrane fusion protein (multidrug efflux system)